MRLHIDTLAKMRSDDVRAILCGEELRIEAAEAAALESDVRTTRWIARRRRRLAAVKSELAYS